MIKYPKTTLPPAPKIGQTIEVYGKPCRITKVREFGTVDVVSMDGERAWRVTGLVWANMWEKG